MQGLKYTKPRFFSAYLSFPIVFIIFMITTGSLLSYQLDQSRYNLDKLDDIRFNMLLISIISSIIVMIISFVLSRRFSKPIKEILSVAEAMRQGNYQEKIKTLPRNEVGYLGETLNHLGEQITLQISTISHEKTQLRTMLTGMVEGIISVDENKRILSCNRSAYRLLNSTLSDCRGWTIESAFEINALTHLLDQAIETKELVEEEIKVSGANKRVLEVYASSYSEEGTSGVIIVLNDVTQVMQLERVRRDFVANVSHEIKTPLTAIRGYAETLLDGALHDPPHNERFVKKIENNALRLSTLVQDLLSLAQIESGDENFLRVVPTDWTPIIKSVCLASEDQVKKHNLEITFENIEDNLIVLGDKESMTQILDNLVTNAIRYTPDGGKISIKYTKEAKMGVLEVSDTGLGIPKKDLSRIFERFYRVDKARSRELGGTGLGLSIVKHLTSKMNGKVSVQSTEGKGSQFSIYFGLPH